MATQAKKITNCVGIEIIDNKMYCSVLTKNQGYVFIEELPTSVAEMGSFVFSKEASKEIKDLFKKNSIKIRDISLVIPTPNVAITKSIELGVMPSAAIFKALPFELQELGAGPDFIYDYAITGVIKNPAKEVTGLSIFAMGVDSDHILDQKDVLKGAALNLHTATCREVALGNIIRSFRNIGDDLDIQDSTCFIDIGFKSTKVLFYRGTGESMTPSPIECGISGIIQALARGLSIDEEKAKSDIYNNAPVDYSKIDAVTTLFTLIAKGAVNSINHYNSENRANPINEIICIGEGAKIPCIVNAVGQVISTLGIPFDTASNKLSQRMQITGEDFDQCLVAIGAALQF